MRFVPVVSLGLLLSAPALAQQRVERALVGTWVVQEEQSEIPEPYVRVLTLHADGTMASTQALQFGLGLPAFDPFSDERGAWARSGRHEATIRAITLTYDRRDGTDLYNCLTTIVVEVGDEADTIRGEKEGDCWAPSVNPLDPGDAEPLFGFSGSFQGHRLAANR